MKKFIVFLSIMATVAVLIFGKVTYGNKIKNQVASAVKNNAPTVQQHTEEKETNTVVFPTFFSDSIQQKLTNNEKVNIVLLASNGDSTYYGKRVKEEVEKAYNSLVKVTVRDVEGTSNKVKETATFEQVLSKQPDMVIWEVPLLADNGIVSSETMLEAVADMEAQLTEKGIQLLLQPSYPLYEAVNYPKQEQALREYANGKAIPYIDYWKQWPANDSAEFLQYVDSNKEEPN
ncbi:MAG: hypothetical protein ACI35O_14360, partial [Bacillaceae bacterium]